MDRRTHTDRSPSPEVRGAVGSGIKGGWTRARWLLGDAEYEADRYRDEAPVEFVHDLVAAAQDAGLIAATGLYIGCGNGRNYLPLVAAGLDLLGLDVSATALEQLGRRAPERRGDLVHGDLSALPDRLRFPLVIGIQVFQHGDRATVHSHFRSAQERVSPGGLFCVRVNAVGTDVAPCHDVTERHRDGGFTVRYLEGPKAGLDVHFFSASELNGVFGSAFEPVLPLRRHDTSRTMPNTGRWSQWEAI